ncbi:hypothetical protein [Siccirubricoccus phaeus]|uniref:hypothetical protein n=1 Tax=Siccirubricoccus phaeus TaxID=2595053 RepID=UPI0011F0BB85|nr:hypothetical protein [Siccirubricoccus phaeus]
MEQSAGGRLAYRGQDANDPLVCTMANGERRFLGYWAATSAFYRSGRAELTRLVTGVPSPAGREERLGYFSLGRDSNSIHVYETWRVVGTGPVQVLAGTFDAFCLERRMQVAGTTYSYVETIWLDQASGAPLKVQVNHQNAVMAPSLVSWEATDLRTASPVLPEAEPPPPAIRRWGPPGHPAAPTDGWPTPMTSGSPPANRASRRATARNEASWAPPSSGANPWRLGAPPSPRAARTVELASGKR